MAKTRQELKKEIDELQEYIDAVEAARECNLELADSVYDILIDKNSTHRIQCVLGDEKSNVLFLDKQEKTNIRSAKRFPSNAGGMQSWKKWISTIQY